MGDAGRERHGDEPLPVSASLDRVLDSLRAPGRRQVGGVFGGWDEVVGPQIAAHVRPVRLDGAVLTVVVDEPAWATQVTLLGSDIRRRLSEVVGVEIERLEVRVDAPRRRGR